MTSQHPDGYDYADETSLLRALDEAQRALIAAGIEFLVMGGLASAVWGRPRWTRDVDLFVRPEDAGEALAVLTDAGFETWVQDQHWLSKAKKHGVVVDIISRSHNDILLDEEMLARAVTATFKGLTVRVLPAEDLVVMKAVAANEDTFRYWYDAIGVIGRADLDWDYLIARARPAGARRVLSLLLYAQSVDLLVSTRAIGLLAALVLEPARGEDRPRELSAPAASW